MSNTKIKASQFHGVVGHGTDGYFLMTNADGSMSWSQASTGPSVTSVAYPGDDTAADPAGGQTVVLTGTGFATSGMTVSIGGTTAPSVAHDSNTQLTITTPAKAAGDYDIVVTNGFTGASGTLVNGISYNGVPAWTTAAGSLGTFDSNTTISTITLQATEPDGGTITFNITNGALPTGLSLTGANIDGTTTAESSTTLYSFTIEAIDDENQATPRNFSITVNAEMLSTDNFDIIAYTGTGSTYNVGAGVDATVTVDGGTNPYQYAYSNTSFSSGKKYFEVKYISGQSTLMIGIINTAYMESWTNAQTKMYYAGNGQKYTGGTGTSYGAAYAINDIISVLYDGDNRTLTFWKNGSSIGTAFTGLITNYPSYRAAISTGYHQETASLIFESADFTYTPPAGYSAWGASTMSVTSGSVQSAVAGQPIDFQPDLVWIKSRDNAREHILTDSVRGVNKELSTDSTATEESRGVTSFNSNGFTLDNATPNYNGSGEDYVAWCWKGGGTASSNTDGSITSSVSANVDAGFSIATFTGTGSNSSFGHGLNSAPELVIIKNRFSAYNWITHFTSLGAGAYMLLNELNANASSTARINTVDSSVINIGTSSNVNANSQLYLCYSFHSITGYQKVGSYEGDGGTSQDITTGFQPRFLMVKNADTSSHWFMYDSVRGVTQNNTNVLLANNSAAELTNREGIEFLSDGFRMYDGDNYNINGNTFVYLAIA